MILHGDYCYSAENVTNEPICRSCWRKPHETGVPKPKGFDEMMAHYLKIRNTIHNDRAH